MAPKWLEASAIESPQCQERSCLQVGFTRSQLRAFWKLVAGFPVITASFESAPGSIVVFATFMVDVNTTLLIFHMQEYGSRSCSTGARFWSDIECTSPFLPCSSWKVLLSAVGWSRVLSASAQQASHKARWVIGDAKSLIFRRSKPLLAVLRLMRWRALPFCGGTLCTKATRMEQLQRRGMGFSPGFFWGWFHWFLGSLFCFL